MPVPLPPGSLTLSVPGPGQREISNYSNERVHAEVTDGKHSSKVIGNVEGEVLRHSCSLMFQPIRNPSPRQVINRQLNSYPVACHDPDMMYPHLPSKMRQDLLARVQFDLEQSAVKCLEDPSLSFYKILF